MSTSYTDGNRLSKPREPLFRRFRSYYRAPRSSQKENLASDQIYMDINRISKELEAINIDSLNKIKIILDKEKDNNFTILNNDGSRSISLEDGLSDSLTFYSKWKNAENYEEIKDVHTMDYLSSRLSKAQYRLNRLERQ